MGSFLSKKDPERKATVAAEAPKLDVKGMPGTVPVFTYPRVVRVRESRRP